MSNEPADLLSRLQPDLDTETYVFVSLPGVAWDRVARLDPVATCREREGQSLVLRRAAAEAAGLDFAGSFRRISLGVASPLEAVGLTAAVSAALAEAGIAANVVAGYWHDHIFVPAGRAGEAMCLLEKLAS